MKLFTLSLITIIMLLLFSSNAFSQLQAIEQDSMHSGKYLQNLIVNNQIEKVLVIRPFGRNTDTIHYTYDADNFQFSERLLVIGEELIYMDSIMQISINKALSHSILLHSSDAIRHYNQEFKNNPEKLSLVENRKDGTSMIGQLAPDFTATTLSGREVILSRLRGKAILLNFWFLGCQPCRKEIPDLNRIAANFPDIEIISIVLDSKAKMLEHIKISSPQNYQLSEFYSFFGNQIQYEIIPDGIEIIKAYNFTGYPINFFIDQNGVINSLSRYSYSPDNPDYGYQKLAEKVKELLKL